MVDVMNSSNNISNPPRNVAVGILAVPDKLPKTVLFNDAEAKKKFKVLSSDVFHEKEKLTYEKVTKTPSGVFALGGILIAAVIAVKTGAYSKMKNILKARV